MKHDTRQTEVDLDRDEVRFCLTEKRVYHCRKCGLELVVTVQPDDLPTWPILLCPHCWNRSHARVVMDEVSGPFPAP